jgi:hypothetical protein
MLCCESIYWPLRCCCPPIAYFVRLVQGQDCTEAAGAWFGKSQHENMYCPCGRYAFPTGRTQA